MSLISWPRIVQVSRWSHDKMFDHDSHAPSARNSTIYSLLATKTFILAPDGACHSGKGVAKTPVCIVPFQGPSTVELHLKLYTLSSGSCNWWLKGSIHELIFSGSETSKATRPERTACRGYASVFVLFLVNLLNNTDRSTLAGKEYPCPFCMFICLQRGL